MHACDMLRLIAKGTHRQQEPKHGLEWLCLAHPGALLVCLEDGTPCAPGATVAQRCACRHADWLHIVGKP